MTRADAVTGPAARGDAVGPWPVIAALTVCALGIAVLLRFIVPAATFRQSDFFGLWSCARIAVTHGAKVLYRHAQLHDLQVALGVPPADYGPFPYPPPALLFLPPAGWMPMGTAYVLTMTASFLACMMAMFAGARIWRVTIMLVPALTAMMANFAVGQTGFLTAALFLGGLRLAPVRPEIGGVLIGLLSVKPQLGLLLPVALAAAGAWRCMVAAAATAAALGLAATAVFGFHIWGAWLHSLPLYVALFDANRASLWMQPTVTAFLRALGTPSLAIDATQGTAAVLAVVMAWRVCRAGLTPRAILGVAAATFLATPHAFLYDAVMLAGATLVYANHQVLATGAAALRGKALWLVAAGILLPAASLVIGPRFSTLLVWPAATLVLLPRRDVVRPG